MSESDINILKKDIFVNFRMWPKNSVAIFRRAGLEVFGLLNVPKNLKIGFF